MKPGYLTRLGIAALWLSFAIGCQGSGEVSSERDFLRKPVDGKRTTLTDYPMERQIDLYLAAMTKLHPPDLALADVLASHGDEIIPLLKERIHKESGAGLSKLHLIDVFVRMQERAYFDVSSDSEVMSFLREQAEAIPDDQWRSMSLESLNRIMRLGAVD